LFSENLLQSERWIADERDLLLDSLELLELYPIRSVDVEQLDCADLIEREDFLAVAFLHEKLYDVFLRDNFIVIIIDHPKCEFDDLLVCEQAECAYRWYPLNEAHPIDVFLFNKLEKFVDVWRKHTRFFFFDKLKHIVL